MNQQVDRYVDKVMTLHGPQILASEGVAIPDDEEEMNWRIFFAHSQDMQGFRADIFTGGQNEEDHPKQPYRSLRDRWPGDSKSLIRGLAALWADEGTRQAFSHYSNRRRGEEDRLKGIAPCMEILCGPLANEASQTFADALDDLSGYGIGRKTCAMIRAYIQNAGMLAQDNYACSFRLYLDAKAPLPCSSVDNLIEAEKIWVRSIERDFYNVGPALANYMVCDWLLGLWREGRIRWFEAYKPDSVFLRTLGESGKLPTEAVSDFVGYCRTLPLRREWLPDRFADRIGWPTPPRLLNEAIWLCESAQSRWKK